MSPNGSLSGGVDDELALDCLFFAALFSVDRDSFCRQSSAPELQALSSGIAIFGAAFMLSWAAELAQKDIPQSLAIALLALIAVLPEYAVDMYFAWTAGKDPKYTAFALANMTGANRLLIGVGWAAVVLTYWLKSGKRIRRIGAGAQN